MATRRRTGCFCSANLVPNGLQCTTRFRIGTGTEPKVDKATDAKSHGQIDLFFRLRRAPEGGGAVPGSGLTSKTSSEYPADAPIRDQESRTMTTSIRITMTLACRAMVASPAALGNCHLPGSTRACVGTSCSQAIDPNVFLAKIPPTTAFRDCYGLRLAQAMTIFRAFQRAGLSIPSDAPLTAQPEIRFFPGARRSRTVCRREPRRFVTGFR